MLFSILEVKETPLPTLAACLLKQRNNLWSTENLDARVLLAPYPIKTYL